ncbi:MAG TPA: MFS transporter [Gaiellaceae bacterium]|jgi:predicted MFS family arabinose efflux permease|nr:MFS transporter [Gaiellaceae bacterium]
MNLFGRLFRLIWGGDVDPALRPVLAVSLAGSIANSASYPFMGIWAIKQLHAAQTKLAFTYLVGAVLSLLIGYAAGHWSDRIGRRPLILAGWGFQALVPLALLGVGHHVYAGLALLALLPAFGSLGGAADQAMIADLVAPERREAAYASVRVAANLGVTIGPPIGGLLLIGGHWRHLWLGTLVLSACGFLIALRFIPRSGAYAPEGPPARGSFAVIIRDSPFLLFMLSSIFATMTYVATETLLPISVTTTHHLAPATWGVLMVVNPLLVTVFQLRLTRWTASIPAWAKLGVAMPLMGVPFLLLNASGSAPVIAFVILLFVIGEMLWVPTSQAVVAALAPADIRGAYMGAFGSTWSVGWALTPFLGLQVRSAYGDATMWMCVAVVGVIAGILGAVAARGRDEGPAAVGSPA